MANRETTQWLPVRHRVMIDDVEGDYIHTTERITEEQMVELLNQGVVLSVESIIVNHRLLSNDDLADMVMRLDGLLPFSLTRLLVERKMCRTIERFLERFHLSILGENILHVMAKSYDWFWSDELIDYVDGADTATRTPLYYILERNMEEFDSLRDILLRVSQPRYDIFILCIHRDIPTCLNRIPGHFEKDEDAIPSLIAEHQAYKCLKSFKGVIPKVYYPNLFVIAVTNNDEEMALKYLNESYLTVVPLYVRKYLSGIVSERVDAAISRLSDDDYEGGTAQAASSSGAARLESNLLLGRESQLDRRQELERTGFDPEEIQRAISLSLSQSPPGPRTTAAERINFVSEHRPRQSGAVRVMPQIRTTPKSFNPFANQSDVPLADRVQGLGRRTEPQRSSQTRTEGGRASEEYHPDENDDE